MNEQDRHRFVAATEQLVSPREVGRLHQRAEMLARLPIGVQRRIVDLAGSDEPIGFVVEPYAFFLAHEIDDMAAAEALLPPDYRIVSTSMFDHTAARPCAIVGAFNVHTSVFWGTRVELYVIAENQRTGLLTWVIVDYESNTISYDPGQGFSTASTDRWVVTTTHAGEVLIDVVGRQRGNRLRAVASLGDAVQRPLDQRLWLEGNLSVDYGGRLLDPGSTPFGLVFDAGEVARALEVPLEAVRLSENTFGAGFTFAEPFEAACFPFAQHFLTSSFPSETPVNDAASLRAAVDAFLAGAPESE